MKTTNKVILLSVLMMIGINGYSQFRGWAGVGIGIPTGEAISSDDEGLGIKSPGFGLAFGVDWSFLPFLETTGEYSYTYYSLSEDGWDTDVSSSTIGLGLNYVIKPESKYSYYAGVTLGSTSNNTIWINEEYDINEREQTNGLYMMPRLGIRMKINETWGAEFQTGYMMNNAWAVEEEVQESELDPLWYSNIPLRFCVTYTL